MTAPRRLRAVLLPVSKVYEKVAVWRAKLYKMGILRSRRLRGAVVSVGNLTVGGTGKTPMVIWLAEKFLADGKRVAILTRGYRGASGTSDEAELMKRKLGPRVRFGVGKDRFAAGSQLEREEPVDVFLLDDGFQHLQLARDFDIVMIDGSRQIEGEALLPAGDLREPLGACERADMVVVHRTAEFVPGTVRNIHAGATFYSQTRLAGFQPLNQVAPQPLPASIGAGPFYAFCGIGNPEAFLKDLARWRVPLAGHRFFRDHHRYSRGDAKALEQAAEKAGAAALVTTEKDAENLREVEFKMPVHVAKTELRLRSEEEFAALLDRKLAQRRGAG